MFTKTHKTWKIAHQVAQKKDECSGMKNKIFGRWTQSEQAASAILAVDQPPLSLSCHTVRNLFVRI